MQSPTGGVFGLLRVAAVAALTLFAGCVLDDAARELPSTPTPTHPPLSATDARLARRAATRFLDAFVQNDVDGMWGMLSPEAQQGWSGKRAFKAFLERKFSSQEIVYEIGAPHYSHNAAFISVPLALDLETSGDRVVGPPLMLTRVNAALLVTDAGPFGANGPVIGAPAPVRPEVNVPVLIYHRLAAELPGDPGKATETVTVSAFAEQIGWLAANGYETVTVAQLFNAFYYDLLLPPRPVILMFDDGWADVHQHAFPVLKQYGFVGTVAAITGFIGQPGYLTWEQLEEMCSVGFEVASHTVTHTNLAAMASEEAKKELADSRGLLEKNLQRPAQFFVYPYGEPFVKGSEEARQMVLRLLAETGYKGALTTSSGPPYITTQRADSQYLLRRIPVSGGEALDRFAASIEPAPTPAPTPTQIP